MKMDKYRVLVINPGSTSTKIAVFEDEEPLFKESLQHSVEELAPYGGVIAQYDFRKEAILKALKARNFDLKTLSAIAGRGGVVKPIESGVYHVNDALVADLKTGYNGGMHASNLGGLLARDLGDELGIPSFIADPVSVDEMEPLARITGLPEITRTSVFHALNQKAMARKVATEQLGKKYEEINLIVVHLGGGVSVGAHKRGRAIDVNNATDGDGPFSPERCGTLPLGPYRRMVFKINDEKQIYKKLVGGGGLVAHLGTNDAREVERRINAGDEKAHLYYEAMAYQIAKEIAGMASVLKGDVDGIVITGGMARSKILVNWIRERVDWIAEFFLMPGEFEVEALAWGALRVLRGEEQSKEY